MGTRAAEMFAKPLAQDELSGDPLVATHISNRTLKAAESAQTIAKSERPEAIKEYKIPGIGAVADKDDVLHTEIANPLIRVIMPAYQSDFFPVLLLLAIYTLFAFSAALFLLLGWIMYTA
ncbi:hypothetical protein [Mesorhizobium sp. 43Arga]